MSEDTNIIIDNNSKWFKYYIYLPKIVFIFINVCSFILGIIFSAINRSAQFLLIWLFGVVGAFVFYIILKLTLCPIILIIYYLKNLCEISDSIQSLDKKKYNEEKREKAAAKTEGDRNKVKTDDVIKKAEAPQQQKSAATASIKKDKPILNRPITIPSLDSADLFNYKEFGGDYYVDSLKNESNSDTIVIPASFNNKPVVGIEVGAFAGNSFNVKKIILNKNLLFIEKNVFITCDKLESVFYEGTEEDWANLVVENGNSNFVIAKKFFYSQTQPQKEGDFWHFDENGKIVVW